MGSLKKYVLNQKIFQFYFFKYVLEKYVYIECSAIVVKINQRIAGVPNLWPQNPSSYLRDSPANKRKATKRKLYYRKMYIACTIENCI